MTWPEISDYLQKLVAPSSDVLGDGDANDIPIGSDNAIILDTGPVRERVRVHYDVDVSGKIFTDESNDKTNWREMDVFRSGVGGEDNFETYIVTRRYIRTYLDSDQFTESNVTFVELSSK